MSSSRLLARAECGQPSSAGRYRILNVRTDFWKFSRYSCANDFSVRSALLRIVDRAAITGTKPADPVDAILAGRVNGPSIGCCCGGKLSVKGWTSAYECLDLEFEKQVKGKRERKRGPREKTINEVGVNSVVGGGERMGTAQSEPRRSFFRPAFLSAPNASAKHDKLQLKIELPPKYLHRQSPQLRKVRNRPSSQKELSRTLCTRLTARSRP